VRSIGNFIRPQKTTNNFFSREEKNEGMSSVNLNKSTKHSITKILSKFKEVQNRSKNIKTDANDTRIESPSTSMLKNTKMFFF
jgi:K+/H+ antiporter YhaU regulatory subunit KhtT